MKKLTAVQLRAGLAKLPEWKVADGKLHREYKFPDFTHAFGFMALAATSAERMGHHPEWFNVYNRVVVDLATHDAGGITKKDLELAGLMESFAKKLQ